MQNGSHRILAAVAVAAAFSASAMVPVSAQDAGTMINDPNPAHFQVYGTKPPKPRRDSAVQGELALRISAPGTGDPWAVGVNVPTTQPVKAGDRLTVYFWARLEKGANGATTARLPAQIQGAQAPYGVVFAGAAQIGPEWKLYQVTGRADRDYAAGEIAAAVHLNTGNHTVDIGLIAILNAGQ